MIAAERVNAPSPRRPVGRAAKGKHPIFSSKIRRFAAEKLELT
jgi:hypothetical protein